MCMDPPWWFRSCRKMPSTYPPDHEAWLLSYTIPVGRCQAPPEHQTWPLGYTYVGRCQAPPAHQACPLSYCTCRKMPSTPRTSDLAPAPGLYL